jgi:hypothetical protein
MLIGRGPLVVAVVQLLVLVGLLLVSSLRRRSMPTIDMTSAGSVSSGLPRQRAETLIDLTDAAKSASSHR